MGKQAEKRTPDTGQGAGYLTAREAAARLDVHERTVRRAIARGELAATKRAGCYRIAIADIEQFRQTRSASRFPIRPLLALTPLEARPKPLIQLVPPIVQRPPVPETLTSLVGRDETVAAVCRLVQRDETRLLVLTGPGGVGKTRVALRVAQELDTDFADGVYFITLAPISDPTMVLSAIAQAVGAHEDNGRPILDRLKVLFRESRLLLVLDNFEHVVTAAPVVADLIASCHGLKALVTSRTLLRVIGEQTYVISPLPVIHPDHRLQPDELAAVGSVRLFVERAQAVAPQFALTDTNSVMISDICHRLDGLPLAIELAAARVRHLPPAAILSRLEQHLPVLTGGPADGPSRQRTMRDAILWSYGLLKPEEQTVFRRLSAFVDGWTLEASEAVAGEGIEQTIDMLDRIAALIDHSLIVQSESADEHPRFRMLETVREVGLALLAASGEEAAIRRRHAVWCLALVEQAEPELYGGPRQAHWLARLETEHDNVRTALVLLATTNEAERELQLTGALFWFWYVRGHFAEGRRWLEQALARGAQASAAARARALLGLGMLTQRQGAEETARRLLDESLALAREAGLATAISFALGVIGLTEEDAGHHEQASAFFAEALSVYRAAKTEERRPLEALLIAHLGVNAWGQGAYDQAMAYWEEALALHRSLSDSWGVANILEYLAIAACDRGDLVRAAGLQRESLRLFWETRSTEDIATGLAGAASICARSGEVEMAARLFGAADRLRATIGSHPGLPEAAVYERAQATTRALLPAAAFAAASTAGAALAPVQAMAEATDALIAIEQRREVVEETIASTLTPRELDVLRLLVAGRTDREISDALFISRRTAMTHVSHVLAKLGVTSRGAAAVLAVREHLV